MSIFSSVTGNLALALNHTQRLYKKVIVNTPLRALQATPHKVSPAAEESQVRYVSGPDQNDGALNQP